MTTLRRSDLIPIRDLIPELDFFRIMTGFHRNLRRVRNLDRGCLLLRTPGLVSFLGFACVLLV